MSGMSDIHKSPLRYPGGKNCIYTFMKSLLEDNDLVGVDYAEPYAGGAGLALRLLMNNVVRNIYINDYDSSIYAFWYTVLHNPDELCSWIESVKINIRNWEYYKEVQRNREHVDCQELAKSTLFLNRTNVSGVLSGGPIGGMNQTGKYKIDVRFNKSDLINRIHNISLVANRIILSRQDGIDFISELDAGNDRKFIYLDPPYYKKGSFLYMNAFKDDNHRDLSERVVRLNNNWLVSYDNQRFILDLYQDNPRILYKLSQCTSNRVGDEVLIFDCRLLFDHSIQHLNSPQSI